MHNMHNMQNNMLKIYCSQIIDLDEIFKDCKQISLLICNSDKIGPSIDLPTKTITNYLSSKDAICPL
jgi:hypothetical protein